MSAWQEVKARKTHKRKERVGLLMLRVEYEEYYELPTIKAETVSEM